MISSRTAWNTEIYRTARSHTTSHCKWFLLAPHHFANLPPWVPSKHYWPLSRRSEVNALWQEFSNYFIPTFHKCIPIVSAGAWGNGLECASQSSLHLGWNSDCLFLLYYLIVSFSFSEKNCCHMATYLQGWVWELHELRCIRHSAHGKGSVNAALRTKTIHPAAQPCLSTVATPAHTADTVSHCSGPPWGDSSLNPLVHFPHLSHPQQC